MMYVHSFAIYWCIIFADLYAIWDVPQTRSRLGRRRQRVDTSVCILGLENVRLKMRMNFKPSDSSVWRQSSRTVVEGRCAQPIAIPLSLHYARDVVAHPTPDSVTVIVKLTNGATIRPPPERLLWAHVLTLVRVRLVICVCLHLLELM